MSSNVIFQQLKPIVERDIGECMVKKPTLSIHIVIPVKHSYLVVSQGCKNLSIPDLLFESVHHADIRAIFTYE